MAYREGRIGGIGDKNVRPAVSIEIGDKDLKRAGRSGHLTGDYLCGAIDVTASGLTTSDVDRPSGRADGVANDYVRNTVTVEVSVGNSSRIVGRAGRIPKSRQNGSKVD
jgi:hypothetical protein